MSKAEQATGVPMQDLVDILLRQPNRSHVDNHIAAVLSARVLVGPTLGPVCSMGKRHWCGILAVALSKQAQLVSGSRRQAKAARVERVGGALMEAKLAAGAIEAHPEHVGVGPHAGHPF